jgi:hypothetical protein
MRTGFLMDTRRDISGRIMPMRLLKFIAGHVPSGCRRENGLKMAVKYIIHISGEKGIKKFGTMQMIPYGPDSDRPNVSSTIDFYIPRSLMWNDKTGYKNFVFALKAILFGDRSHRMNRRACEAFFNEDDNFDLE